MTPLEALEAALNLPDNAKLIIIPPRFTVEFWPVAASWLKEHNFIGGSQLRCMLESAGHRCRRGEEPEEHEFFREKFVELR